MRQSFQSSPSSPYIMTIGNTITVGSLPRTRFRYPTAIPMVRTTTNITQTGLPRNSSAACWPLYCSWSLKASWDDEGFDHNLMEK